MEKSSLFYQFFIILIIIAEARKVSLQKHKISVSTQRCQTIDTIAENLEIFPLFLSQNYEKIEELGGGAQGRVFKVLEKRSQKVKALKCMKTKEAEIIAQYKKEYEICKSVNHSGIIRYEEYFTKENSIWHCFLMEYSEFQPLPSFLHKNKEFFKSEPNLKTFVTNLMKAVAYLHKQKIIHGDIKPNNILVSPDGKDLKLLDFGVAVKLENDNENEDIVFTPRGDFQFRSPEAIAEGAYNEKSDIWACFLLIHSLIYGQTITNRKLEQKNINVEKDCVGFSHDFFRVLNEMGEKAPEKRISAERILDSFWLK